MNKKLICLVLLGSVIFFCDGGVTTDFCCSQPCQKRGVCISKGLDAYECDCTRTGYYGENCTTPELSTWIRSILKPNPNTIHYLLTNYKWIWGIINNISFLRNTLMRYVLTSRSNLVESPPTYNADYEYKNWEAYSNTSYYTRTLPPVPKHCPSASMPLPDVKQVVEKFLMRQRFIPDPQGTNLMFAFFAQHFTHQFFKSDFKKGPAFTKGLGHGVDLSNVYGDNLERQHKLRLFKDGKLKYQVLDGEVYPPLVKDVQISCGRNLPAGVQVMATKILEHGREVRYQSFNAYRARFNLEPYNSFEELTGDKELTADLKSLYGAVNSVELYTGLLVEKPRHNAVFGDTMVEMGAPYSLKGLMGNPICSPDYWMPSTFGGKVGFEIVNMAYLRKLVCINVKGPCPFVSFKVPEDKMYNLAKINPTVLLNEQTSEL
ncbi:prostaglandin G/H synthase 2 [Ictalurus punctatus]|uniref:prostaglandin-endoperoxide synthase n=1 Tax=Ictalurus punctatus TaxID=7998 RepID=A0A2D0SUF2_ICTPU|nr:prostaglandin G/H synthase 2 [Ictalurus punctatus]